jgi:hypothetical protein
MVVVIQLNLVYGSELELTSAHRADLQVVGVKSVESKPLRYHRTRWLRECICNVADCEDCDVASVNWVLYRQVYLAGLIRTSATDHRVGMKTECMRRLSLQLGYSWILTPSTSPGFQQSHEYLHGPENSEQ